MSAPVLWIFLPFFIAVILMFIHNQNTIALISGIFTLFLAITAWLLPIDFAMTIGNFSFKLTSSFEILGRHLIISQDDKSLLALIYGVSILWFSIAPLVKTSPHLPSLGLAINALLIAALSVEPFLFAALLIEMAVLISIPLLSPLEKKPGKGVIRFLILQTLAMPFILFSGWLLAGIEANPDNFNLVRQAAILIGLGFSFLLAVIPFHSWIPLLMEEASPFTVAFILWTFQTVTLFFGLGFLDHYAWLRDAPALKIILTAVGIIVILGGGIMVAFQQHLGRILGFAVIMQTGYSLLIISLGGRIGFDGFFMLIIPRALSLVVWAFALSILKEHFPTLMINDIKGFGRIWPFLTAGIVLSSLSIAGMPLLAGFPPLLAIWEGLASKSLLIVPWVMIGNLGLFFSATRIMFAVVGQVGGGNWKPHETILQRIVLSISYSTILILGIFPQWVLPIWTRLTRIFIHLGQ